MVGRSSIAPGSWPCRATSSDRVAAGRCAGAYDGRRGRRRMEENPNDQAYRGRRRRRHPNADRPASLTPTQIATLLDASCRAIILEVEALAPHGDYRPIPGTWCPNEVVGHLIEADQHGFAWRIRSMLAEENPILRTWVPSAVAAARHDDGRDRIRAGCRVRHASRRVADAGPLAGPRRARPSGPTSQGRRGDGPRSPPRVGPPRPGAPGAADGADAAAGLARDGQRPPLLRARRAGGAPGA